MAKTPTSAFSGTIDAGAVASGTLDDLRVAESNVLQHEAAINLENLQNYDATQHRVDLEVALDADKDTTYPPTNAAYLGARLLALDTGSTYRCNGTTWVQYGGGALAPTPLATLNDELFQDFNIGIVEDGGVPQLEETSPGVFEFQPGITMPAGTGDVSAAATLPVDEIVTGDTAAKGVQGSGVAIGAIATAEANAQTGISDAAAAQGTATSALNQTVNHQASSTAHSAIDLVFAPGAGISAPNVQGALEEVGTGLQGFNNVDNTADADKPVSGPQQTALDLKADTSALGTAAALDVGLTDGDVVALDAVGLPAVDGSQLTGIQGGLPEYKAPVRVATEPSTDTDIVIATALNVGNDIDGVTLADGDRVLVKNQDTTPTENGIWIAGATPVRADDFAAASSQASAHIVTQEGTVNGVKIFICSNAAGSDVVGTDGLTFKDSAVPGFANGIGAFRPSGETAASNADNGYFNPGAALTVIGPESFGIRFSGKTYGPGWGFGSGSPLHVQALISQAGGPGAHIILRQQDDPSQIAIYRNESPPEVITDFGLNDDTRFADVTLMGATFTNFDGSKLYELSIVPASQAFAYTGSGVMTLSGSTFGKRYGWPLTSHQDWNWQQAFAAAVTAPTDAPYDHTGIMMPSGGVVVSLDFQFYLQNGTSYIVKPELTRLRPVDGASTTTNTAMNNITLAGNPTALAGNMKAFTMSPAGATAADQLVTVDFEKGDKLLITLQEVVNTGGTNLRFEWALKVAFVDPIPVGEAPGD